MVGNLTDYAENKVLDHILGTASFTMPTVHLALWIGNPTDAGSGGAEVSGASYARQAASFSASSGGGSTNSALLTFPTATTDWGRPSRRLTLAF